MKSRIVTVVLVVNICFLSFTAHSDFDVRVIYFKPTDAGEMDIIDRERHDKYLKDIQKYYQSEMTRHGYDGYTFPLELDDEGDLVIHTVRGKNMSGHYIVGAWIYDSYIQKIKQELPYAFNNDRNISSRNDVLLIIFGGKVNNNNWGHGMGFRWLQGRWGGVAAIKEKSKNHYLGLIAHELGHAFGFDPGHNNIPESFNGRIVAFGTTTKEWGNKMRILKFEADVLKSRPIFRKIELKEEAPHEPEPEKPNKNPDLIEEDIQEGEDNMAIQVKPNRMKLTMTWAKVKTSF